MNGSALLRGICSRARSADLIEVTRRVAMIRSTALAPKPGTRSSSSRLARLTSSGKRAPMIICVLCPAGAKLGAVLPFFGGVASFPGLIKLEPQSAHGAPDRAHVFVRRQLCKALLLRHFVVDA